MEKKILKKIKEYDNHFKVIPLNNSAAKLNGYIAIHKIRNKYPSFGATRFFKYKTNKEALRDALRLSKLMSYKSALAGLPYGGAKATIIEPKGKYDRDKLFKAYTEELSKIKNKFITGTDVGVTLEDLKKMKTLAPNLVGFNVNPEYATAYGIKLSIDEALKHVYGNKNYNKRSFAIAGVGKVGGELLPLLIKAGVKNIFVADIDKSRIKIIKKKYPLVKVVSPSLIHKKKVDVYSPCAMANALSKKTIKELNCKMIVGSANNQLESEEIGDKLHKMGILYCPDYIVNAGGLISVVDEYKYDKRNKARLNKLVKKVQLTLAKILIISKKTNLPTYKVAQEIGIKIIKD